MIKAFVFDAYGTLYNVQSVSSVIESAFPEHASYITEVWRLKQLEYTWLRSMMGRYEDFWAVTQDSLRYTLGTLGLDADTAIFRRIADAYNHLTPYSDAPGALEALSGHRLAILSNGSPDMLAALVRNSGLAARFDAVMSVDASRAYKPDPRAYTIVEQTLGLRPDEVIFVSSNGFDVAGAKSFGFNVARIERVAANSLRAELATTAGLGADKMFKALRQQEEVLGAKPDIVVSSLAELPGVLSRFEAAA